MDMPLPAQYAQAPQQALPIKVDVMQYIPPTAVSVTILLSVSPPDGAVLAYAPGSEDAPVLFKGPASTGEIRLNGPFVLFQMIGGATHFDIQYLNWRSPT
jgi:hypothetical protein